MLALDYLQLGNVLSGCLRRRLHVHGKLQSVASLFCNLVGLRLHLRLWDYFLYLLVAATQLLLSGVCGFKDVFDASGVASLARGDEDNRGDFGIDAFAFELSVIFNLRVEFH